jgi:hypothetical protein
MQTLILALALLFPWLTVRTLPPMQRVWIEAGGHTVTVQRGPGYTGVLWYVPGYVYPYAVTDRGIQRASN